MSKFTGMISFVGLSVLLLVLSFYTGAIHSVVADMVALLSGGVLSINGIGYDLLKTVSYCVAVVAVMLPAAIAAFLLQGLLLGMAKQPQDFFMRRGQKANFFSVIFSLMVVEELLARWIFLGLIPWIIPALSGTIPIYALIIAGNVIWSLMHLSNYAYDNDKHPLRTAPQFVCGLFLTVVYFKFGLGYAIMTHFAYDAVVFATDKIQRTSLIDLGIIAYSGICCAGAIYMLDKPVSDITVWFDHPAGYALAGWGFWNYVALSVLIVGVFQLMCDLLLLDNNRAGDKTRPGLIVSIILSPFAIGFLFLVFWGMGLIIADMAMRLAVICVMLTLLEKDVSGSSMARTFWSAMPCLYVGYCIMMALGFVGAIGLIVVTGLIWMPKAVLMAYND